MRTLHLVLLACLAVACLAVPAPAGVVGVDSALAAYTGGGVLDATSRTWEAPASGGTFNLDGNTITVGYNTTNFANRGGGAITLFEHIRYGTSNGANPVDVTLSGLDTSLSYNLVAYGADRFMTRGSNYEVLGSGLGTKLTTGNSSASFIEGTNFVRFYNLIAPTGSLTLRATVGPGGIAMLNGFEIESAGPAPPPTGVVNVDFNVAAGAPLYSGPGVLADAGTVWTQGGIDPMIDLVDSNGYPTSIDMDLDGAVGNSVRNPPYGDPNHSNDLTIDQYHNNGTATMTLTISDLVAGGWYDLALFGADDYLDRGTTFTVGGDSLVTTGDFAGLGGGFSEGDTHVFFRKITADTNGQIIVTITNGTEGIGVINGVQIALVPEPSTFVLAALGLVGFGLIGRRRRK